MVFKDKDYNPLRHEIDYDSSDVDKDQTVEDFNTLHNISSNSKRRRKNTSFKTYVRRNKSPAIHTMQ